MYQVLILKIAATRDLMLSLDGKTWSREVSISQATLDQVSYANHTNSWGGEVYPYVNSRAYGSKCFQNDTV